MCIYPIHHHNCIVITWIEQEVLVQHFFFFYLVRITTHVHIIFYTHNTINFTACCRFYNIVSSNIRQTHTQTFVPLMICLFFDLPLLCKYYCCLPRCIQNTGIKTTSISPQCCFFDLMAAGTKPAARRKTGALHQSSDTVTFCLFDPSLLSKYWCHLPLYATSYITIHFTHRILTQVINNFSHVHIHIVPSLLHGCFASRNRTT